MESAEFFGILSDEEVKTLDDEVKRKLDEYLRKKKADGDIYEGEILKIKADYEQKCYDLDKKLIETTSRLTVEASKNEKLEKSSNDLTVEITSVKQKFEENEKLLHACQLDNTKLQRVKDSWDGEKLDLQHSVEKKDLEIARLTEEWRVESERLTEATASKNEYQLKFDEMNSQGVDSHYKLNRIEQEKDLLVQQNTELANNLNEKTNELIAVKRAKGNEVISLKNELELHISEKVHLTDLVASLKKVEQTLQEKVTELQDKFVKISEEYQSMNKLNHRELQSQTRLADLYKSTAEDAERKSEELISAVEELQRLVQVANERNDELQKTIDDSQSTYSEQYVEMEGLKKELEHANDLITANKKREISAEELAEMCPTAALTSSFMKSDMTLTQLYSQLVEQTDELFAVKEENKRINEAMDQIVEELNEKAPLLKRQREDYDRALATINQLTSQNDEAVIQFQQLRQEADDATRRNAYTMRENGRLRKEANDLSKQVQFLIKETEELRGRRVQMSSPQKYDEKSLLVVNEDGSCNDVSSSSELISKTLVTFKDISELQEQNQKLLAVIRELSEERERSEKETVEERTRVLQNNLDAAREELGRLKEDRERQIMMVEGVVKQRDMYRVLLAQNPDGGFSPSVLASASVVHDLSGSIPGTPLSAKSPIFKSPRGEEKKALLQLQEEYEEYKKDVKENNKIIKEKVDKLELELSDTKSNCIKLEANVEFMKERCNLNKISLESSTKECNTLRSRNAQLYGLINQHEQKVSNLTSEFNHSQETCRNLQNKVDTTRSEMDIFKRTEDRLTLENSSLLREQRNQTLLLNNLQKMQQSVERQGFEIRTQLNSQVDSQDREIKTLRQKNQDLTLSKQDTLQGLEKQLYAVQKMLESEKTRSDALSKELNDLKSKSDDMTREKSDTEMKLKSVEDRLNRIADGKVSVNQVEPTASANNDAAIKELQQDIKEKNDRYLALEARFDRARITIDHLKEVSASSEKSLTESNEMNQDLMNSLQTRLSKSNQRQIELEQTVAKLEEENYAIKNEKYKVTEEIEQHTSELSKQLSSVQSDLEAAIRRKNEAVSNEQIAREDLKQQVAQAEEAKDNYQRQIILHANVMQQLIDLKDKMQDDEGLLEKANSQIRSLEQNISDNNASWSEIESKLKSENEHQKQRISDLDEQNSLLHSQIQTLSSQLVDLRSKSSKPPTTSPYKLFQSRDPVAIATDAAEKGDESTQQLINVIKFLRREKQISDTKCELFQSEIVRLKHQMQQIENQFKDVQTELKQEQIKVQENAEKLAKMSTLEREVNNLTRVKEENSGLKEGKDKLEKEVKVVTARLQKMQDDLFPLQIKNRELSAQSAALQAEKKSLATEIDRWKERVQQMTASPRRQDPEEYKKLMTEKTSLMKQFDSLNHELAELKAESSALKGQIRTLETSMQTSKVASSNLERDIVGKNAQIAKANSDLEEKSQTINRLRRVGRKFKTNYEELLAKQTKENEEKKKKDQEQVDAGGDSANSKEALKEAEECVAKAAEEKARLQAELSQALESQKTLKTQLSESEKKVASQGYMQSEVMGENAALKAKVEDMLKTLENSKKQNLEMNAKEKKFGKLLTMAKSQIEKLRKDFQEVTKERDSLKEDVRKVEGEKKSESGQKIELQTKVEELQRQVLEGRSSNVGQGSEVRKSANIRPIPTQRVNQVNPMRVTQRVNQVNPTRTARVMPEPHQDVQDNERSASSSVPSQVASSSTQSSVPVSAIGSPATAFVHPINPTRQQQHHVVSSGTPIPPIPQIVLAQSSMVAQEHHLVESQIVVAQPSVLARVVGHVEAAESEQAVVSSSDDPTAQEEASSSQNTPSSSQIPPSPSVVPAVSSVQPEASSSTVRSNMGASSTSGVASGRPFSSGQKRTHDEEDSTVISLSSTSTRETQIAPLPKRQRGSPDQSSESVSVVTPSIPVNDEVSQSASQLNRPSKTIIRIARSSNEASRNQIKPDQSSNVEMQGNESSAAESGSVIMVSDNDSEAASTVALRRADQSEQGSSYRNEEEEQEYQEVETTQQDIDSGFPASQSQSEATSSMTPTHEVINDDVIVLSSESEEEYFEDEQVDEDVDEEVEEVEEDGDEKLEEEDDLQNDDEAPSTSRQQNWGSNLPLLDIHPPEPMRQRIPIRPAPLTPGIVPSSTDDGDGIVPCTPTLIPVRRHDESYQMVSSPRVPPSGLQPLQFRFDVPAGQNLNSVPGLEMDDNIVDLAGAGGDDLSVPTTPIPSSSSTVFSNAISNLPDEVNPSTSGNGAVSSSIQEEPESNTEEMDQALSSQVEIQPSNNISTNTIRGRRFRIRGAPRSRPRGGGANSPSTSNQP